MALIDEQVVQLRQLNTALVGVQGTMDSNSQKTNSMSDVLTAFKNAINSSSVSVEVVGNMDTNPINSTARGVDKIYRLLLKSFQAEASQTQRDSTRINKNSQFLSRGFATAISRQTEKLSSVLLTQTDRIIEQLKNSSNNGGGPNPPPGPDPDPGSGGGGSGGNNFAWLKVTALLGSIGGGLKYLSKQVTSLDKYFGELGETAQKSLGMTRTEVNGLRLDLVEMKMAIQEDIGPGIEGAIFSMQELNEAYTRAINSGAKNIQQIKEISMLLMKQQRLMPELTGLEQLDMFKDVVKSYEDGVGRMEQLTAFNRKLSQDFWVEPQKLVSIQNKYHMFVKAVSRDSDMYIKKMTGIAKATAKLENAGLDAESLFGRMEDFAWGSIGSQADQMAKWATMLGGGMDQVIDFRTLIRNQDLDSASQMLIDGLQNSDMFGQFFKGGVFTGNGREQEQFLAMMEALKFDSGEIQTVMELLTGKGKQFDESNKAVEQTIKVDADYSQILGSIDGAKSVMNEMLKNNTFTSYEDRMKNYLDDLKEKFALENLLTTEEGSKTLLQRIYDLLVSWAPFLDILGNIFLAVAGFKGLQGLGNLLGGGGSGGGSGGGGSGGSKLARIAGSAPGALMTAGGLYGMYEGGKMIYNAGNKAEEDRLYGDASAANTTQAVNTAGGALMLGAGGTMAVAGGMGIAGGLSAAAGGAGALAAAGAGLAAIPVAGWIAAGVLLTTAVGVAIYDMNRTIYGSSKFIESDTQAKMQATENMMQSNIEYTNAIKDSIKESQDLNATFEQLRLTGIIPTGLTMEQLGLTSSVSVAELGGLNEVTDDTQSRFAELQKKGLVPSTTSLKDLTSKTKLTESEFTTLKDVGLIPTSRSFDDLKSTTAITKDEFNRLKDDGLIPQKLEFQDLNQMTDMTQTEFQRLKDTGVIPSTISFDELNGKTELTTQDFNSLINKGLIPANTKFEDLAGDNGKLKQMITETINTRNALEAFSRVALQSVNQISVQNISALDLSNDLIKSVAQKETATVQNKLSSQFQGDKTGTSWNTFLGMGEFDKQSTIMKSHNAVKYKEYELMLKRLGDSISDEEERKKWNDHVTKVLKDEQITADEFKKLFSTTKKDNGILSMSYDPKMLSDIMDSYLGVTLFTDTNKLLAERDALQNNLMIIQDLQADSEKKKTAFENVSQLEYEWKNSNDPNILEAYNLNKKLFEEIKEYRKTFESNGSTTSPKIDGSHKTGLENVPFDGYVAELHKDEAVLTKSENQQWKNIKSMDKGPDSTGSNSWYWPVQGPDSIMYAGYGNPGWNYGGKHSGIDIHPSHSLYPTRQSREKADILAASSGKVIHAGSASGYGSHTIVIAHPALGMTSEYGHNSAHFVKVGQQVNAGQAIGKVGTEGQSTGQHLHFQLRSNLDAFSGSNIDPLSKLSVSPGGKGSWSTSNFPKGVTQVSSPATSSQNQSPSTLANQTTLTMQDAALTAAGSDTLNNFPYYRQTDKRWGGNSYPSGTISSNGCGPTSLAMVLTALEGKRTTPDKTASWMVKNGQQYSWTEFDAYSKANSGIRFDTIDSSITPNKRVAETAMALLNQGNQPLILSGKNQKPFSSGGHFVVAVRAQDPTHMVINNPAENLGNGVFSVEQIGRSSRAVFKPSKSYKSSEASSALAATGTEGYSSYTSIDPIVARNQKLSELGISVGDSSIPQIQYLSELQSSLVAKSRSGAQSQVKGLIVSGTLVSMEDAQKLYDTLKENPSFLNGSTISMQTLESAGLDVDGSSFSATPTTDLKLDADYNTPSGKGIDNKGTVYKFLRSKGFSSASATGVMGNLMQESSTNIDPTLLQNGKGPGIGIVQWTRNERWQNVLKSAKAKGVSEWSLLHQLEYLMDEMSGTGYADKYESQLINKFAGGLDKFKALTDPVEAARIFHKAIERSADTEAMMQKGRFKYAKEAFNQFGAYKTGGLITSPEFAQIGEDAPRYPEYVIPTNPAYRDNAMVLFNDLAQDLGVIEYGDRSSMSVKSNSPNLASKQENGANSSNSIVVVDMSEVVDAIDDLYSLVEEKMEVIATALRTRKDQSNLISMRPVKRPEIGSSNIRKFT